MTRHGIDELSEDLALQRAFVLARVPVYARLLEHLQAELEAGALRERLARCWAGRQFSSVYERPLLLLAALRFDALCEGPGHPLHAAIAAEPPALEAATRGALAAALDASRPRTWESLRTRLVQTNETSRAVAWLWPAQLLRRVAGWERMMLLDLGTSAGLNLVADALPMPWARSDGAPLQLEPRPSVARRLGVDRAPLALSDEPTALWLRACVWPGEVARQARLEQGIAAMRAQQGAPGAPELRACDLGALGDEVLRGLPAELPVLAVQTIVRDYLPPELRERHRRNLHAWLSGRPPGSAVWVELELEPGGDSPDTAAAITAHLRGHDGALTTLQLARCHPHPTVLHVDEAALAALAAVAGA
jgi:hypothetical protein